MRVIKSDSGFLVYQKIFKFVKNQSSNVVLWQVSPSGQRQVSHSRLNSFHLENSLLDFVVQNDDGLNQQLPVYCYSEDGQFIFKTEIKDVKDSIFTLQVPEEIKLLEDPDVTLIQGSTGHDLSPVWRVRKLNIDEDDGPDHMVVKSMKERTARDQEFLNNEFNPVTLDEEEKLFADKRETPRARPKKEKWVKILSDNSDEIQLLKLFDLSQGGLAFVTMDSHLYPKGTKIRVMGFEEFDLDDPLVGEVMSQRAIDETQIEFKIGCKFDEGQD